MSLQMWLNLIFQENNHIMTQLFNELKKHVSICFINIVFIFEFIHTFIKLTSQS